MLVHTNKCASLALERVPTPDIWRRFNLPSIPSIKHRFKEVFHEGQLRYSNLICRLNICLRGLIYVTKVVLLNQSY